MHNVRTRDYCAITAKVKGERVSRSAHTGAYAGGGSRIECASLLFQ